MKIIPLTKGYIALIDDVDFDLVNQYSWQAMVHKTKSHITVYAARGGPRNGTKKRGVMYMHRLILGCSDRSRP